MPSLNNSALSPKTAGLIIVIIVILLGGAGWYIFLRPSTSSGNTPTNGAVTSGYAPPGVPAGARRPLSPSSDR